MSSLSTLPKGDSAWLLRKAIERIIDQVSVLETNIGVSTSGNSANTQIIFNDDGTLRGDAGLVFDKTTDKLTIAGNVQAASATITGDLTVKTNVLKVDTTNNFVGINTASPGFPFDVNGNTFVRGDLSIFSSTGGAVVSKALTFGSAANTACASIYGLTVSATAGQLYLATETGGVMTERLQISDTGVFSWLNVGGGAGTAMTLNSTANLVLKGGTAGANGVGLTFPATQVASSDANCLDDYEEGTWTGTLKGSTTDPTVALTATGVYTKIGRVVTVIIRFSGSTVGASGAVSITGLPFASSQETSSSVMSSNALTFTGIPALNINAASSTIEFFQTTSSSPLTTVTHSAGLSRSINVSLTYVV